VSATRSVDRTIEIAASVDDVWHALTDASELVRWFPLGASVADGVMSRSWGAGGDEVRERVLVWEPGQHLRTEGLTGVWTRIITDYWLVGRAGGTTLRVVSSGFGGDADWDDLVDAFGGGWDFELRGLRHYLERHRGHERLVARAQGTITTDPATIWRRLTSNLAVLGLGTLVERVDRPPTQLVATVPSCNDALLRIEVRATIAILWLSTYGVPERDVRATQARWQRLLHEILERDHHHA
jgi:uncharacterized protein YndB with AHSA1/START domain